MDKMRILATCQYGWPEPYPSLYPMEEMAKRGHFVHAITGIPNYPMGDIYKGYEHHKKMEEEHNGVYITHVPVIARKHDSFHRFLNYHSYPIMAKRKVLSLPDNYDVVFANQSSPVMMVEPAIAYGNKYKKRVVMYCMDLWPASLCVGGVKKDSALYNFYWKISKRIYEKVDVILVTSRSFKNYLIDEFGIESSKIDYLPQYALSVFDEIPKQTNKDTTDFVFAGNVGFAQNLEVILRAARIIEKERIDDHGKKIQFHIVGDGQALDSLKNYKQLNQIKNVIFHGRKPFEEMPKYYSLADAMIVTMLPDPYVSLTLPAKVQSYMAAGKPIIASADGEIKRIIKEAKCGFCAKANDETEFVEIIKKFINVVDCSLFEKNSINYYRSHFSVEIVIGKLEKILQANCFN